MVLYGIDKDCNMNYDVKDYDINKIIVTTRYMLEKGQIGPINIIKDLIKSIFCFQYFHENKGNSVIFFESIDYEKAFNYRALYKRVMDLDCTYSSLLLGKKKNCKTKIVRYIPVYFRCRRQILAMGYKGRGQIFVLSATLLRGFIELDKIKNIISKYKVLVVLCDVHPIDALVVQYAKKRGMKTITMQHGHFNAKDRPWVYSNSEADFFFLHGQYAFEEAIESGHSNTGLISVGMMNYIGIERKHLEYQASNKTFALILNGPGAKEDNEAMIRCANTICDIFELNYIVRAHPAIPVKEYENIIKWEKCERVSTIEESINSLLSQTQFTMVGNSTVFIESLYMGSVTYRFVGVSQDIYEKIQWCAFRTVEEFEKKYEGLKSNSERIQEKCKHTLDYLCETGDIGENYRQAINKIVGEI